MATTVGISTSTIVEYRAADLEVGVDVNDDAQVEAFVSPIWWR
jgi:hypothetical protein